MSAGEHSSWVYRKERGQRKAARLLANLEESHRRIQAAQGYDQSEYDKPADEEI